MTGTLVDRPTHADTAAPTVLVWVDAREAIIVRWQDGAGRTDHLESEVPARIRSSGQVRHAPGIRHGGGAGATAAEQHRQEHLARWVAMVADRLPAHGDLAIVGPGTVRESVALLVRERDRGRPHSRTVTCEPADRMSDAQLVARLRTIVGDVPRRRAV